MQKSVTKKQLTYNEALAKLAALCSRSEQCTQTCRDKLAKWEIAQDESERIIDYLVKEKYVDDQRYARFFANDKHQFAHWGKTKIANALRLKKIPQSYIDEALGVIDDDNYEVQLEEIIFQKIKSVKAKSNYEMKGKLFRFALGRGFEGEKALRIIDKVIKKHSPLNNDNEDGDFSEFEF